VPDRLRITFGPVAPAGFDVTAFAVGLDNPRWLYVLPNGDVLVTKAKSEKVAGELPPEKLDGVRASDTSS